MKRANSHKYFLDLNSFNFLCFIVFALLRLPIKSVGKKLYENGTSNANLFLLKNREKKNEQFSTEYILLCFSIFCSNKQWQMLQINCNINLAVRNEQSQNLNNISKFNFDLFDCSTVWLGKIVYISWMYRNAERIKNLWVSRRYIFE